MDITIYPRKLQGEIIIIPSKSHAHRVLICAAFSDKPTDIFCPESNQDIEATVGCLSALGAKIVRTQDGYLVIPIVDVPGNVEIDCQESGSTLRFLLPILCALGTRATIHMSGRLPQRPLSPLWEVLEAMGCRLSRPTEATICTSGSLRAGEYDIAGNVSSQFISGLLFALSLINGESTIHITGKLESEPYVLMTQKVLADFGVKTDHFVVSGYRPFHSPGNVVVEGDWSNGAFFLTAAALGSAVEVTNLSMASPQGDRAIQDLLSTEYGDMPVILCGHIPDLVPILAVYFATRRGAVFQNIARLRLKESDRVESVIQMLRAMGIRAEAGEDTLTVYGGVFHEGVVDACGDHRIAMAAAIAASVADGPVTILGAQCVAKSYPAFWQEYRRLGGCYEQYLR